VNSRPAQKLDAAYANPNPLPFSKAEASLNGETIKVFLELTAGGYNGSTYTLTYDPSRGRSSTFASSVSGSPIPGIETWTNMRIRIATITLILYYLTSRGQGRRAGCGRGARTTSVWGNRRLRR
jgi:hypothetical protein